MFGFYISIRSAPPMIPAVPLPGCISEGDTKKEALKNIREAIELYLEQAEDDQQFSPQAESLEIAVWAKCR